MASAECSGADVDPDSASLIMVCLTFFLAGGVKGVIGLGLPTVSLALLAIAFDLTTAMALLLIPSLVTNAWQAVAGGYLAPLLRRLWPLLLLATVTVWIGGLVLTRVDLAWPTALLGALLIVYAGLNLGGYRVRVEPRQETWAGPLCGMINGILTGMTGSFVVPGVLYLQALGLPRDRLVQAMGILFTLSTLALAFSLQGNRLLSVELGYYSALGLVPALAGMLIGLRIRATLDEDRFRRIFFVALLVVGGFILLRQL